MRDALAVILALAAIPVMLVVAYLIGRVIAWLFNWNDRHPGGRDPSDPNPHGIGGSAAVTAVLN
jgi:hypothetical protein